MKKRILLWGVVVSWVMWCVAANAYANWWWEHRVAGTSPRNMPLWVWPPAIFLEALKHIGLLEWAAETLDNLIDGARIDPLKTLLMVAAIWFLYSWARWFRGNSARGPGPETSSRGGSSAGTPRLS